MDKPTLRREALALRARVDEAATDEWAESASHHFFGGPLANQHGDGRKPIVAGYWPHGSEFDVRPLLTHLHECGHIVCLPVCTPKPQAQRPLSHDGEVNRVMQFRVWTPQTSLEPDGLGIDAPPPSAEITTPDIVISPLLAFTAKGDRLGYGAGYYDATLADLRNSEASPRPHRGRGEGEGAILLVGYAYAEQEVPSIPVEPHDIRLDWIVTESFAKAIS